MMTETKGTGWIPDYPDLRDYTLKSEEILSGLSQVQGTQILGSIESQQDKIIQLFKKFAETQDDEEIANLTDQIVKGIGNELVLKRAKLLKEGDDVKESSDVQKIPDDVIRVIVNTLFPNSGSSLFKLNQDAQKRLINAISPLVKLIAQLIAPIGGHSNLEKVVVDRGIKYLESVLPVPSPDIESIYKVLRGDSHLDDEAKRKGIESFASLIASQKKEKKDKSLLSDSRINQNELSDNNYFEYLVFKAILEVKLALIAVEKEEKFKKQEVQNQKILQFNGTDNFIDYLIDNSDFREENIIFDSDFRRENSSEPIRGYTYELWFKADTTNCCILSYSFLENEYSQNSVFVDVYLSNGNVNVKHSQGNQPIIVIQTFNLKLDDGKWHHLAHVFHKDFKIYVDGKQDKSWRAENTFENHGINSLSIGYSKSDKSENQNYFKGEMTEIRIWEKARNSQEIADKMKTLVTGSEPELLKYWRVDQDNSNESVSQTQPTNSGRESTDSNSGKPTEVSSEDWLENIKSWEVWTVWNTSEKLRGDLEQYFDRALTPKEFPFKKALRFDGSSYIVCMKDFHWEGGDVTVEFWARVNETDVQESSAFTVGGQNYPNRFQIHLPWIDNFLYWDYGKGQLKVDYSPYLGRWTYIALVSEGKKNGLMSIYLNGERVASNQKSDGFDKPPSLQGLWIGAGRVPLDRVQEDWGFQKGEIAEFCIWKRVRTQKDIRDKMFKKLKSAQNSESNKDQDLLVPTSDLVGYWPLNEGKWNQISDPRDPQIPKNQGFLGSLYTNSVAIDNSVDIHKKLEAIALEGDGEKVYLNCGKDKSLDIKDEITVEAWVKCEDKHDGVIVNRGGGWCNSGYSLFWATDNIRVELQNTDPNNSAKLIVDVKAPDPGLWHHIAFTWAKRIGEAKIYIDGKLTEPHNKKIFKGNDLQRPGLDADNDNSFTVSIGEPSVALNIGRSETTEDDIGYKEEDYYFKGLIAEVRLWKIVRTAEQIEGKRWESLVGTEQGLVGYWLFDERQNTQAYDKFINRPKWVDISLEKETDKIWVYKKEFSQSLVSDQRIIFEIKDFQEDSQQDDEDTTYLQVPVLSTSQQKLKLPNWFDLSIFCSPIEDQGSLNSCSAHVGVALMEYFQKKSFGKHIDASRLFLYKATRNLMRMEGDVGTSIRNTMKAMALFGVPPEEYWPYREDRVNDEPNPFCYAFAQNYQALKYFRLDHAGITKKDILLIQIKAMLVAGFPCVFGFTVYESIHDPSNPKGHIPLPHKRDKSIGGHAVVAVGYDDYTVIKNADVEESTGALIIRNSWGSNWGAGGYGWLPYDYVLKGLTADWWSMLKSEWFDTGQFGLGANDWTSYLGAGSQIGRP